MKDERASLLSAEEFEALIQGWGIQPNQQPIDKFFGLRLAFVFFFMAAISLWLLFDTEHVATILTHDTQNIESLQNYLYFRGWFVLGILGLGVYSYTRGWYTGIVFSLFLVTGTMNFISDLFTVYPERLANPTPFFTVTILARLTVLWILFISIKNISRMPERQDRWNIFLPFQKDKTR